MSVQVHKEVADSGSSGEGSVGADTGHAAAEGGAAQGNGSAAASDAGVTDDNPTPGSEEDDEPAVAAYKPKEKFKVRIFDPTMKATEDKLQKEELVPDWLKPLMKDEASEKQVLELLEKAHGLDPVKAERAHVRTERDQFKQSVDKIMGQIGELRETYQRGDIDLWLQKLQIPEERMLQWALDKVNYSKLDPDQQRVLDERTQAQRQAWEAQKSSQTYEQQLQEQVRFAKHQLLESGLSRPDVSSFAEAFDTQAGKPGAFKAEIFAEGQLAWAQSNGKIDLTPDQAIERVMAKWSKYIAPASAPAASAAAAGSQGGGGTNPNSQAKPAVIPNVTGRSSSPMKSKPRSIDDLKKLAAQANK